MKRIELTGGHFALVDDEDYIVLSTKKWHAYYSSKTKNKIWWYARRTFRLGGKTCKETMHHAILGKPEQGYVIDHIDGDGLNNQRSNLRICSNLENRWNQLNHRDLKTSRFIGVYFHKERSKWCARINRNKKCIWLGSFKGELNAAIARDVYLLNNWSGFDRLNVLEKNG
jgi:hypothetical protein